MSRDPRTDSFASEARGITPRAFTRFWRIGRGPGWLALLIAALLLGAIPGRTAAQSVRPVIVEHHGKKTRAKFELVNDGLVPLNVVIEPKSFDVSIDGEVDYRPLDPSVHLKLSAMSLRIPARQSRYVFYEASADSYPAWFVIPCTFSGMPRHQGLNVTVELPHTVYLVQDDPLRREDVKVHSAVYAASAARIYIELENVSPRLGRVASAEARGKDGKAAIASFPLLPHRIRRVTIPWDAAGVPTTLRLAVQDFKIEMPLGNASQVAGSADEK
jgi:hypothetical protein